MSRVRVVIFVYTLWTRCSTPPSHDTTAGVEPLLRRVSCVRCRLGSSNQSPLPQHYRRHLAVLLSFSRRRGPSLW